MALSKEFLSGGSANGRPIKMAATATPGTLLHTAHATAKDEIFLSLTNTDVVEREVTIEWGGTTSPDDHIKALVPPKETILAVPGKVLSASLVVRAFCNAANVVNVIGYVNRQS